LQDIEKVYTGRSNDPKLAMAMTYEGDRVWISRRPYVKLKCAQNSYRDSNNYTIALDRFLLGVTRTCPRTMGIQQAVDLTKLAFCAKNEGLPLVAIQPVLLKAAGIK